MTELDCIGFMLQATNMLDDLMLLGLTDVGETIEP
jgi:hypothetical protein